MKVKKAKSKKVKPRKTISDKTKSNYMSFTKGDVISYSIDLSGVRHSGLNLSDLHITGITIHAEHTGKKGNKK